VHHAVLVRRLQGNWTADGAAVAITYSASPERANEVVAEIKASGGRAVAIKADAADEVAVRRAVAETVSTFGGLDILVNNAGIAMMGDIADVSVTDFDRMTNVNVKGVFVAVQESLKHMKSGGRIINIGSVMSETSIFPTASIYTMTKAAVAGLTRGLARDLGPRGITINNVQPGPIDTEMNPGDGPSADGLRATIPMGRFGKTDEIGNVVAFLASPAASFVNGAQIRVDGGGTA